MWSASQRRHSRTPRPRALYKVLGHFRGTYCVFFKGSPSVLLQATASWALHLSQLTFETLEIRSWNLKQEKWYHRGSEFLSVCELSCSTDSQICKHSNALQTCMHTDVQTRTHVCIYRLNWQSLLPYPLSPGRRARWHGTLPTNGFLTRRLLGDIWEKALTDLKRIIMSPTSLQSPFLFMVAYTLKLSCCGKL